MSTDKPCIISTVWKFRVQENLEVMVRKYLNSWSPEVLKFREASFWWFRVREKHGVKSRKSLNPRDTKFRSTLTQHPHLRRDLLTSRPLDLHSLWYEVAPLVPTGTFKPYDHRSSYENPTCANLAPSVSLLSHVITVLWPRVTQQEI
jgi:hypothetical protein